MPIHLTAPIMVGGLIKMITERMAKSKADLKEKTDRGILLASGYIAGEALMGVIVAIAITAGVVLPENPIFGPVVSILAFAVVIGILTIVSNKRATK